MARTNKCKVCGWTGEPDGQRRWLGANHNLCSNCVTKCDRCGGGGVVGQMLGGFRCPKCLSKGEVSTDTPPSEPRDPMPPMGMMAMAAMAAAVSVAPHRRKP